MGPLRYESNRNVLNKRDDDIRWWLSMGRPKVIITVPIWKCVGLTPIWSNFHDVQHFHTHFSKKLSCRREATRCFVFVCSQLQHTYSAVFLLPITAASDLLVHKILLWLGYPMVKNFRRYLYLFWCNSQMCQTHRQTDGQTPHDSIGRAYASHCVAKTSSASHVNFNSFVVFMYLFRSKIF